jgi:hypothetical protein
MGVVPGDPDYVDPDLWKKFVDDSEPTPNRFQNIFEGADIYFIGGMALLGVAAVAALTAAVAR